MPTLLLVLVLGARAEDPPDAAPVEAAALAAPDMQRPEDREWAVATSRMLGAASSVREKAWQLGQTADAVQARGRISAMSALSSDARELHQAVASAVLASEVLGELAAP